MDWTWRKRLAWILSSPLFTIFITLILIVPSSWISCDAQITPPPKESKPVISDGRIWWLRDIVPDHCKPPIIDRFPGGKVIKDNRALLRTHNPHIIRGNIEIAKTGCLYIEPGSVLKFGPGYGIIVNGTLIARVGHIFS